MPQITVRGPDGPPVTYRFEQDAIAVGRAESNDVSVLNATLSRVHARLRRDRDRWIVEDLGSRNGTFLNGRRITGAEPIRPGDEVALGDVVLIFDAATGLPARVRDTTKVLAAPAPHDGEPRLLGDSAAMRAVRAAIDKVASSPATALITGESGTGKEMVARLIHARSTRRMGPFVVVNCPALPGSLLESELFGVEKGVATGVEARRGRLEMADGGSLLLDEVGDLDSAAQAKLLRFLQDKTVERVGGREVIKVDVRLLAATHHELEASIARGTFRRDLYHRLNVVAIHLPPLRERREDIPSLVECFLEGTGKHFSAEALAVLATFDYPGNVRELQHLVERAQLMSDGSVIGPEDVRHLARSGAEPAHETTLAGRDVRVAELWKRVVDEGQGFWDVVQKPFLRREVSRETVRALVERGHAEGGRSYKGMARLFGIENEHKRLLDFVRNHGLRVKR